jgi:hypothetical protein
MRQQGMSPPFAIDSWRKSAELHQASNPTRRIIVDETTTRTLVGGCLSAPQPFTRRI